MPGTRPPPATAAAPADTLPRAYRACSRARAAFLCESKSESESESERERESESERERERERSLRER